MLINKRILIVGPPLNEPGGVSGYYQSILPPLSDIYNSGSQISYLGLGARAGWVFKFKLLSFLFDLCSFTIRCLIKRPHIIHINPSLLPKSLVRDSFIIIISRVISFAKIVVFFRGWNTHNESFVKKWFWFFKRTLLNADQYILLTNHSKIKILSWGVSKNRINKSFTVINPNFEDFLKKLDKYSFIKSKSKIDKIKVLFLGRLIREKGIYEMLEGFLAAHNINNNMELVIAGNGPELDNLKAFIIKYRLSEYVKLLGHVSGEKKYEELVSSHIFLLPSYTEGMPNSVLEAMAAGCIVYGTPVGALEEFIDDDLIKPLKIKDSESITKALLDNNFFRDNLDYVIFNSIYARKTFGHEAICSSLSDIYAKALKF